MKQLLVLCIAALLILSACTQTPVEPPATTLPTVESTTAPPSAAPEELAFEAFYEQFKAAVSKKDMQFIDGILDDGVISSFGGDPGKAYFYEHWDNEKEYNGRDLWTVLEEIVALGGVRYQPGEYNRAVNGECFVAPYTFVESRTGETDFGGGYRLCIEKKENGWKLLWLIAGD
jgi:hypothetical protein